MSGSLAGDSNIRPTPWNNPNNNQYGYPQPQQPQQRQQQQPSFFSSPTFLFVVVLLAAIVAYLAFGSGGGGGGGVFGMGSVSRPCARLIHDFDRRAAREAAGLALSNQARAPYRAPASIAARIRQIVNANKKMGALVGEAANIAREFHSGDSSQGFGSRRLPQRYLLVDATPRDVRSFVDLITVNFEGFDGSACVSYLSQHDRSDVKRLGDVVRPGRARQLGCQSNPDNAEGCRIVVDDDVAESCDDVRQFSYKGLFEAGVLPTSDELVPVIPPQLASAGERGVSLGGRIMFIAALRPGKTIDVLSGRTQQMFSLNRIRVPPS